MRKTLITLCSLALLVTACKKDDATENSLHLTGTVNGLKQGKLYLKKIVDTSFVTIDSFTIKGNSDFESTIKIDSPEMYYLFIDRGTSNSKDNSLMFFAEPGNMTIKTDLKEFYAQAKVTGSKNNDLYEDYKKIKSRYTDEENQALSMTLFAQKMRDTKMLDSLRDRSDKLVIRRYLSAVNFAVNNAKYDVAPYIALTDIYDANIKYLDTIQKSLSPEVTRSHYGKLLQEYIGKRKQQEATTSAQ
ncbi:DUF4369 domain-containing protein [Flavobacterium cerinum]|uniref:DUF4369 domain-containing protein n=1 Tax=Flavobacterium cerinum TaxID=2502784 RepID=A0ABY5IW57_9FLAO|nr:DUF4369 domain-containing protein [Flavobacterium cerinum]UUC47071.1 DUF4369 domain-containing protein [Flavobacterium cerinum]